MSGFLKSLKFISTSNWPTIGPFVLHGFQIVDFYSALILLGVTILPKILPPFYNFILAIIVLLRHPRNKSLNNFKAGDISFGYKEMSEKQNEYSIIDGKE